MKSHSREYLKTSNGAKLTSIQVMHDNWHFECSNLLTILNLFLCTLKINATTLREKNLFIHRYKWWVLYTIYVCNHFFGRLITCMAINQHEKVNGWFFYNNLHNKRAQWLNFFSPKCSTIHSFISRALLKLLVTTFLAWRERSWLPVPLFMFTCTCIYIRLQLMHIKNVVKLS